MCGRYYIEIDDRELQDICDAIARDKQDREEQLEIKLHGEIFPTDIVPVQTGPGKYQAMKWGFAGFDGKPVINARSETAMIKPMFRDSMQSRRCLIPASGYYEWSKGGGKKTKYRFYIPENPLYLAGCYRKEPGSPALSFVILTRDACGGAEAIHNRMPVILPRAGIEPWFNNKTGFEEFQGEKLLFEPAI
jgi:putative SOS response-associated peptidase YedK